MSPLLLALALAATPSPSPAGSPPPAAAPGAAPAPAAVRAETPRAAAAAGPPGACVACHRDLDDESLSGPPRLFLAQDVHAARGFGCHDCHGGNPRAPADDPDAAHDEDMGFVGAPDPTEVPALCARCHADGELMRGFNPRARIDQLAEYRTSRHGKRLAEEEDTSVATCASCHGAHGILAVKDPRAPVHPTRVAGTCGSCHADAERMARHGLPADQVEKWEKSVHGRAVARGDLAAPTCNGCHGNHGAAPPEVASVANVCGTCHTREAILFAASPLKRPWDRLGLKECIKCHSNHLVLHPTDSMVGADAPAVCTQCHEHGPVGLGVAAAVRGSYDELQGAIHAGEELLDRAEQLGMEISEQRFKLAEARDHLVEARVLVHSFDKDTVREKVDSGLELAAAVESEGEAALEQVAVRRRGLWVAVALILVAVLALWLRIRELEPGPAAP